MRGGLTLVAGVLAGNLLGFVRVALTAYFLGTHSRADSLAVAMGPMDALNSVLINSVLFAFVPMLTACGVAGRAPLFRKLNRVLVWGFSAVAAALILSAPLLMRALAPGLAARDFDVAVTILRVLSLSTVAAGMGAVYCALLYTSRRFLPTAFYQAALNLCTIVAALLLWKTLGVYAFAVGYTAGAWAQLAIVWFATRSELGGEASPACEIHWRAILAKPALFAIYAIGLGLNITFTRAYCTHAGPGMAAALDYCLRGVGVPLAILVTPIANSLLPEIARLRSLSRLREAFRLIDRTTALAAVGAVAACTIAVLLREPAIRIVFQRGEFRAQSTAMVSAVFLTLGPSLIGWSLLEIASRSLFALDRPWPPVIAAWIPVLCNAALTLWLHSYRPQLIGLGASLGLLLGFLVLFAMVHVKRARWLAVG
ncbi:MAG TPA: lipid II flippase MurJ [Bryobacteraceae bacterium]|nr:lipid II flippase MurJ [Bryobacteraceae bacterium]